MTWTLLLAMVLALGLALFGAISRRNELRRMAATLADRDTAVRQGSEEAQLQHPVVDLSRCLGCGTCVAVCPEDGVLDLVHGQAMVVNGARCVGVAACERECPVDAITVTLSNLETRNDIPAISSELEAIGTPGLFLAGEVTAHALIKTAIDHGTGVARTVAARRDAATPRSDAAILDLCIVGAGPAGIACALEAKRLGLDAICFEQESSLGGTVAKYPRRKLVLTQPVDLPLHGRLKRTSYSKEQLMDLWRQVAIDQKLPIQTGESFVGLEPHEDGTFTVATSSGKIRARAVCLALGRRGMPARLDVPGEELPKVSYSLIDAHSFQDQRILVVGGGDSAAETAIALAEQPGNEVTLSYRKESFFRLKTAVAARLEACITEGRVQVAFQTEVAAIHADSVDLHAPAEPVEASSGTQGTQATKTAPRTVRTLANDQVFVMVGGTPMTTLLEDCGVRFDPSLRDAPKALEERGTGLVPALAWGLALTLGALVWALFHVDYYGADEATRIIHPKHSLLRPGLGLGLWLGIAATGLILINLAYVLRRAPRFPLRFGTLRAWMTSHVGTGVLAFLCALLHGAMAPGDSPGGHALWALLILLVTGAIGRYFYAHVPRATNGRELELAEVRQDLGALDAAWDSTHREFTSFARGEAEALISRRQWGGSFAGRVMAFLGLQFDLRRTVRAVRERGVQERVPMARIEETVQLVRAAHRGALTVAHFEDLRAILNTWRYLHRWVAALLVLLVVVHIVHAMTYGAFAQGGVG